MKSSKQTFLNSIIDNNATLSYPITVANDFNKYFSTITLDIQSCIRYSKNRLYNSLYTFLQKKSKLIYWFEFGFRQKNSTTYALVHIIELIRKQFDVANYACCVFVDFRNAFDTVDCESYQQKSICSISGFNF